MWELGYTIKLALYSSQNSEGHCSQMGKQPSTAVKSKEYLKETIRKSVLNAYLDLRFTL